LVYWPLLPFVGGLKDWGISALGGGDA
jgi:hypothetical protein